MNGSNRVAPDLRQKVMQAVEACDYAPKVGRRVSDSIGVIYAGPFTIGSPYDSACLDGIATAMRETNYDLSILNIQRDRRSGESFSQLFARKGLGGAIVRSTLMQRDLVKEMASEGLPIVILGDHFECPGLNFCYADSRKASREAIEHLVSLGHQAIAFAACDRDDGDHLDRHDAYRSVLEKAGLYREDMIHRVPPSRMDGAPLIRRIMSKQDRPTALFVADPLVAVGVLNEAHELGIRVPEDLSLIAVDDTDMRSMVFPRLTAVCQDSKGIGQEALETVYRLLEGKDLHGKAAKRQDAWFEIHDTTAPPPETVDRFLPGNRRSGSA